MSLHTKIMVIGAGSASYGENTLSALVRSKRLRGSHLANEMSQARHVLDAYLEAYKAYLPQFWQ